MSYMFCESGMSTSNYDGTRAGWAAFIQSGEGLQPDVQLGADGLTWCESEAARRHLIEKAGWTIMGDRRTTACAGSNFPEIDPVLSRVRATTPHLADSTDRSEERRVGKECRSQKGQER